MFTGRQSNTGTYGGSVTTNIYIYKILHKVDGGATAVKRLLPVSLRTPFCVHPAEWLSVLNLKEKKTKQKTTDKQKPNKTEMAERALF